MKEIARLRSKETLSTGELPNYDGGEAEASNRVGSYIGLIEEPTLPLSPNSFKLARIFSTIARQSFFVNFLFNIHLKWLEKE